MKNKRAILMQNALSLIIAVIGLALIFYAAYSLYFRLTSSEESESAKGLIDVIEAKINAFDIGESANVTIRGVNGEDWQLLGFDLSDADRPDACFFESCIYVCKRAGRTLKEDCRKIGFYRKVDFEEVDVKTFELLAVGESYKAIYLPNELIELQIEVKIEDGMKKLAITHFTEQYLANKNRV